MVKFKSFFSKGKKFILSKWEKVKLNAQKENRKKAIARIQEITKNTNLTERITNCTGERNLTNLVAEFGAKRTIKLIVPVIERHGSITKNFFKMQTYFFDLLKEFEKEGKNFEWKKLDILRKNLI
jgi:hypothetical protein